MKIGCSLRLFCSSSGRPTCNRTQWLQPWDLLLLSSSYLGEGCVPTRRRSIPCTIPCTTMLTGRRRRRLHRRLQRQQRLHLGALHLHGWQLGDIRAPPNDRQAASAWAPIEPGSA